MSFVQYQMYNGAKYMVSDMIDMAKDVKAEYLEVKSLSLHYSLTDLPEPYYDLQDVANTINVVNNADLNKPIIMYRGFVMDGKHRLTKAIMLKKKKIKVKIIDELPEPKT